MRLIKSIIGGVLALGFIAGASAGASAGESNSKITVPISIDDNDRMAVWVQVGEHRSVATIDTAATFPMVDRRLLNDTNSAETGAQVEVIGVGGSRLFAEARVGPVAVGDTNFSKLSAAVNGRKDFPGHRTVIPANVFQGRVLDFDFQRDRLDVYNAKPDRTGDHVWSKLAYSEVQGLPFIRVKVNGTEGWALIDTGSDVTYLNTVFADRSGAVVKLDKTKEIFGATGESGAQIKILDVRKLSFGHHAKRKFEILSANTPIFAHLGLQDEPVMVMGMDVLRHFRLQIDRETSLIYLGRPENETDGRRYRISPFSGRVRRYSGVGESNY